MQQTPGLGSVRKRVGEAAWMVVDQVVSSSTTFLLSIVAAHLLSARDFGQLSIYISIFAIVGGIARTLVTDPLLIRFSGKRSGEIGALRAGVVGASVLVAVAAAVLVAAGSTAASGALSRVFPLLVLLLVPAVVQDGMRFTLIAQGRIKAAVASDSVWLVVQLALLVALIALPSRHLALPILAWSVSAVLSGAVAMVILRTVPRVRKGFGWVKSQRDLGLPLTGEFIAQGGVSQLAQIGISLVIGLSALGSLRLALLAFGPMTVLQQSVARVAMPQAIRAKEHSHAALTRYIVVVSAVLAVAATICMVLALYLPLSWTTAVFGEHWPEARKLAALAGAYTAVLGIAAGPVIAVRALGAARRAFHLRLWCAPVLGLLPLAGGVVGDAEGALVGLVIGAVCLLVAFSLGYRAELRQTHDDAASTASSVGAPAV